MRCFLLLVALFGAVEAVAQTERYQAIAVPHAGQSNQISGTNPKVFILDTQEGYIWTWSENETIYDTAGSPKIGTVLIYQGKLRPGNKPGDIIEKQFR